MIRRSSLARSLTVLFAMAQLLPRPIAGWADAADEREASARAMPVVHILVCADYTTSAQPPVGWYADE